MSSVKPPATTPWYQVIVAANRVPAAAAIPHLHKFFFVNAFCGNKCSIQ